MSASAALGACNRCSEVHRADPAASAPDPNSKSAQTRPSGEVDAPPLEATILPPPAVPPGPPETLDVEPPIGPEHVLNLSYTVEQLAFEVRLNGIEIAADTEPASPSRAAGIERYLRTGKNTLDVTVTKAKGDGASGSFRLFRSPRHESGEQPKEQTLLEVKYTAKDAPLSRRFVFEATSSPYRLFRDTEVLELDQSTARELVRASLHAHGIFANHDVPGMVQLLSVKAKEMGILLGTSEAEAVDNQRKFLIRLMRSAAFTVLPLDEKDLHLELVADGHLVHVTRRGKPLFMSGFYVPGFDAYFGKLDGGYVMVR